MPYLSRHDRCWNAVFSQTLFKRRIADRWCKIQGVRDPDFACINSGRAQRTTYQETSPSFCSQGVRVLQRMRGELRRKFGGRSPPSPPAPPNLPPPNFRSGQVDEWMTLERRDDFITLFSFSFICCFSFSYHFISIGKPFFLNPPRAHGKVSPPPQPSSPPKTDYQQISHRLCH